jgi:uncharacterized protein YciI
MYYVLTYDVVEDYVTRRQPYRPEHLALAKKAHEEGKLVLAGALVPPDGALFVWKGDGPADAEAFARSDPYVRNGVVRSWRVREWTVVVGGEGA